MTKFRSATIAAIIGVVGVAATACGSSSSGSGGAKPDIRLMVDTTLTASQAAGGITFPYPVAGAKAAAAAINKAGGVDGRMIKIDPCDNKGDPNASAACGRKAKANGDIAVVGTWDPTGAAQLLTSLKAVNIPDIGGVPASPIEFNSPMSFQFDPGPTLGGFAISKLFVDSGCKNVAQIAENHPGVQVSLDGERALLTQAGVTLHTSLLTPGTVDVTPLVSSALAKKPDCLSFGGDGQTNVKVILSAQKQGYTGKILVAIGSLLPPFLKTLGAKGNGIYILNSTLLPESPDPMVTAFRTQLKSYLGGSASDYAQNANEFAQDAWSAVQLVKQALTGEKTTSAATLLKKIPTMCDVNVGNVYPHVNFCKPASSKTLSRVYNDSWQYFKTDNGTYEPLGNTWHDLSSTIPK